MTQDILIAPIKITTVPCAACGMPSPIEEMTPDGTADPVAFYCGRLGTESYYPDIKACEDRQRAARNKRRVDDLVAAADEVEAAEAAGPDTAEPATETADVPASTDPAEPAETGARAGDAS